MEELALKEMIFVFVPLDGQEQYATSLIVQVLIIVRVMECALNHPLVPVLKIGVELVVTLVRFFKNKLSEERIITF